MVKTKCRMKGIAACRVILDNCIPRDIVASWNSIQDSGAFINVIFNKMIVNRIAITLQWGEGEDTKHSRADLCCSIKRITNILQ